MGSIRKILGITDKVFEFAGMAFLVGMVIIISFQVFTRQFLNFTPHWSEEVAMIFMVWFGFIGMAIGVHRAIHLSIEYFVSILPTKWQRTVHKIDDFIVAIFGFFLMFYGYKLVQLTGGSTLPATQWPSYVLNMMAPVSGFMMIVYSLARILGIEEDSSHMKIIKEEQN